MKNKLYRSAIGEAKLTIATAGGIGQIKALRPENDNSNLSELMHRPDADEVECKEAVGGYLESMKTRAQDKREIEIQKVKHQSVNE